MEKIKYCSNLNRNPETDEKILNKKNNICKITNRRCVGQYTDEFGEQPSCPACNETIVLYNDKKAQLCPLYDKEMPNPLTKAGLMSMLEECAREYRTKANNSLRDHSYYNKGAMKDKKNLPQKIIDALLVDFIECVGIFQGLNWGLHTSHIKGNGKKKKQERK